MAEVDLERRRWLKSLAPKAAETVGEIVGEKIAKRLPAYRRPPGAISEPAFLAGCTKCMDCVKACPHFAIYTLTQTAGIAAETPVMVPDKRACHMCEGFPCAVACPEKVLIPPKTTTWPLGKVRLNPAHCFVFRGPECGACANLCPPDAPALTLKVGKPVIDHETCVGCGLCIEACPTQPKAIELLELER